MRLKPTAEEVISAFHIETGHHKDKSWVSGAACPVGRAGRDGAGAPSEQPGIDFASESWREACVASKKHIPAGYTYLGQLIGHDMGHSVPITQVPYAVREEDETCPPKRHNAIENPLTLETLYGAGPRVLPHLYDQETQLFRINRMSVITLAHRGDDASVRAIADARNRDVHLLHRKTAIMMRYHNRVAEQFYEVLPGDEKSRRHMAFSMARNHVLRSWHSIIRDDFLPWFLDPAVAAMTEEELRGYKVIDAVTAQHGLMRAFHALPRKAYKFPELRDLGGLVLRSPMNNEHKLSSWPLDWSLLFDEARDGTKTGISASFSPLFRPRGGVTIDQLDAATARDLGPQSLDGPDIQAVLARMPAEWSDRLAPATLAQNFTQQVAAPLGFELTEAEVARCHIHLILMIEAQLYGTNGSFGPLGSLLLRCKIEDAISRVRMVDPSAVAPDLPQPSSFMQIINIVNS